MFFDGSAVDNHSIVTLDEIMNTTSTALLCITPAVDCCTAPGSADWFSPSGSVISTLIMTSDVYQVKGSHYADLRRSSGGEEGLFRCDIRLSIGADPSCFYVGIFESGNGIINYVAIISLIHTHTHMHARTHAHAHAHAHINRCTTLHMCTYTNKSIYMYPCHCHCLLCRCTHHQ